MISILNPHICTSSAFSHSVALLVMCSYLAPIFELTTWNFAIDSLPFNLYFIYLAFQFKRNADAQSSRKSWRQEKWKIDCIYFLKECLNEFAKLYIQVECKDPGDSNEFDKGFFILCIGILISFFYTIYL